jgi:hypothetical protein
MAEPFSVAAAGVGLAQLCLKTVARIYEVFSRAKSVDATLSSLADQVNSLATVLKSISETNTSTEAARQGPSPPEQYWAIIRTTMDDCEQTLNNLKNLLEDIYLEKGRLVRRVRMQVGTEIQTSQINSYKETIEAFCGTMQISLQLLTL